LASSDKKAGFNPLRWDCDKYGCFNIKRRPKIEVFSDCFPGRINFGDVDGIVEINGKGLMLEWKSDCKKLPLGQQIMYERLTDTQKITVIVVIGDPETMVCREAFVFFGGKETDRSSVDLEGVKLIMLRWVKWARYGAKHEA